MEGHPTVLFYGHYDVQPVDPAEEWISPPFEPVVRNGRVYARGASDDKGQVLYVLKSLEQLVRAGSLRARVKILLEGEEESGSGGLQRNIAGWGQMLKADVLMVADTDMTSAGAPAIVVGLRGLISATVEISGPLHDLHSGMHGGVAPNPAAAMARLISGLHTDRGTIAVEGFYDGIKPPNRRENELARNLVFDPSEYVKETGVPPVGGDQSRTPVERLAFQPSIDINGIHSGYGGKGSKTVLPARALAKITCRLAAGQDPDRCLALLRKHLASHAPAGLNLSIAESGVHGPGFRLNPDSPMAARAKAILDNLTGKAAEMVWSGASIPIVSALALASGAEPLLVGFSAHEDAIHAPNESFAVERFRLGFEYAMRFLSSL
jgi:acetylornithine deacetylase/succinyl-diaminopimelate desuccinylase-like protein